MIVFF